MKKYLSAKALVKDAIEAHKEGNPFNPAGVSGLGFLFFYRETDEEYSMEACCVGTSYSSPVIKKIIFSLNKLLDEGTEVDVDKVHAKGVSVCFHIKDKHCETTHVENAEIPAAEESEAVPSVDTVENTESETVEAKAEIDLVYLESLKGNSLLSNTEKKKALDAYALAIFKVNLDRRKSFDNMIAQLTELVNADDA